MSGTKREKRWNKNKVVIYTDHLGVNEFADPGSYN
jgi:hypothetical protein